MNSYIHSCSCSISGFLYLQMSSECNGEGDSSRDCILVTGGAGYVGSHTVIEVMSAGYLAVVVDNLCNSSFGVFFTYYIFLNFVSSPSEDRITLNH